MDPVLIRQNASDLGGSLTAFEFWQSYFPDHVDLSLRLPSYWAQCELEVGDYAAAKEVWEAALRTPLGT